MAIDDEAELQKNVALEGRAITKSTQCANCTAFDADATRVLEEWLPVKENDEARIRQSVLVGGGLQIAGFDRGDAALRVARICRERHVDTEEAIRLLNQEIVAVARERVGEDYWKADQRYRLILMTERDIKSGRQGRCRGGGVGSDGKPVGFLVFSGYHCHKWNGRTGHSVAHEGRALDPLPAELLARADEKAKDIK